MSKKMTWLMMVGKKRRTRVRGQHGLDGCFSRKRASSEVGSLCGRMGYAIWSEAKLVKRCSTGLGRVQQGDGWSVCGGDGGNHGCNPRQHRRMRCSKRGSVTAWRGSNGATRNLKRRENMAERRRVGREQTLGAPIFSCDAAKAINFWRSGSTMNQFSWADGDD